MASSSLGIACGGNNRLAAANFGIQDRCRLAPPCSVVIGDLARSTAWNGRISMSATVENRMSIEPFGKREDSNNGGRDGAAALEAQERLDTWMRDSVVEIVKNLKEAPLLVQVFSKRKGEVSATSTTTEKQVVLEDWPAVKERWESGETPVPEGVIFVEEIGGEDDEEENGSSDRERTTRAWGIVVQGKGVGCGPVCYLLKTSRVGSGPGSGTGLFSTHFCLVRVKSFRESVESQLKNCWLLQSHWQ